MKITSLVTGGAGFIGSHVVDQLIDKGHNVIVLDDLSGGSRENVNPKVTLYIGSITDVAIINNVFQEQRIDYVYHLAAYAAEGLSHFIRGFNYENNLLGSVNLINASVNFGVKCFVFTSSIAVYGKAWPMSERTPPHPEDPYGIAKLAVEQDLANAHSMFDLDYIIFRPHNVFGPRQNIGDKYRNVIGIFMNQILNNERLTVFGDGSQTRAFTYIDDIATYIANSVEIKQARNHIFNIGSDNVHSVKSLAKAVCEAMGTSSEILELPARNEVEHAYSDHSLFNSVFSPNPLTTLDAGLLTMANWVKAHGAQISKPFSKIEITKNLPESWN